MLLRLLWRGRAVKQHEPNADITGRCASRHELEQLQALGSAHIEEVPWAQQHLGQCMPTPMSFVYLASELQKGS